MTFRILAAQAAERSGSCSCRRWVFTAEEAETPGMLKPVRSSDKGPDTGQGLFAIMVIIISYFLLWSLYSVKGGN
jgi:hypothetical protein